MSEMCFTLHRSTTQVPHETIEHLQTVIPGQEVSWYIRIGQMVHDGVMPMPMGQPQPQFSTAQPPRSTPVRQEKPRNVVSDEAKAQLISVYKTEERAAAAAKEARKYGDTEDEAWRRAYDNFMDEKVNLYANIGYYS